MPKPRRAPLRNYIATITFTDGGQSTFTVQATDEQAAEAIARGLADIYIEQTVKAITIVPQGESITQ